MWYKEVPMDYKNQQASSSTRNNYETDFGNTVSCYGPQNHIDSAFSLGTSV